MSFLKKLGQGFKTLFKIGTAVAVAAEPWVDLAVPEVAGLFNTTLSAIVTAEGVAEATAQNTTGSGPVKSAAVIPSLLPIFQQWATKNNVVVDETHVKAATDAAVAFVNSLPQVETSIKNAIPAKAA